MIQPTEKDVGRQVVYTPIGMPHRAEEGVITSFNEMCVFVRYGADTDSKGTMRKQLEWSHP